MATEPMNDFEQAARQESGSVFKEFWSFLRQNKKWWLLPILLIILLQAVLLMLGGGAAAPFIYPLF